MKTHSTGCRSPLLGLSLLALACAGHAQNSVTLYGVADAGMRYGSGLNAAYGGAADSSTGVNSGINTTSRFGFRGVEDLGGGLKAIFNLESGVNLDTGASASATKLFDRAANVGCKPAGEASHSAARPRCWPT